MLLGVRPFVFLARLLFFFALTFLLWEPLAPIYTKLLALLAQVAISATELIGTPATRLATTVFSRGDGIFFMHKGFPGYAPPGVPSDWVQANMVLLLPLMLATPAPDLRTRFVRLGIALAAALALQVLGLVFAIKVTWSNGLGPFSFAHYGDGQRTFYQFADAFFQSFDTQLFPVAIWAGVHFRQLLGWVQGRPQAADPRPVQAPRKDDEARAARRAKTKAKKA
jgi:hypothetical protein